jgi:hypothetical protein
LIEAAHSEDLMSSNGRGTTQRQMAHMDPMTSNNGRVMTLRLTVLLDPVTSNNGRILQTLATQMSSNGLMDRIPHMGILMSSNGQMMRLKDLYKIKIHGEGTVIKILMVNSDTKEKIQQVQALSETQMNSNGEIELTNTKESDVATPEKIQWPLVLTGISGNSNGKQITQLHKSNPSSQSIRTVWNVYLKTLFSRLLVSLRAT